MTTPRVVNRTLKLWLILFVSFVGFVVVLLPTERITEGPRPAIALESNVDLTDGATVQQEIHFDTPVVEQVAFRVWVSVVPSARPYLFIGCAREGQIPVRQAIVLPPVDEAYHAVNGPWCDTPGQRDVRLVITGHGVRIMATAADRVPGSLFKNGVSQAPSDLVLQVRQRQPGIDRYVPVSRWAEGKPGVLGWKHVYLLLGYIYSLLMILLLALAPQNRPSVRKNA